MSTNLIDFKKFKTLKEMQEMANATILQLENALYKILDAKSLEASQEIAADALNEDLATWVEEDDLEELDFDNGNVNWEDIPEEIEE